MRLGRISLGTGNNASKRVTELPRPLFDNIKYPFPLSNIDMVLDAGCGYGSWSIEFASQGAFVCALDFSQRCTSTTRVSGYRKGLMIHVIRGDVQNLPFRPNTFSRIFCADLLEHIKADQKTIKEFVNALRKGGLILVKVPASSSETMLRLVKSNYFASIGHLRTYRISDMIRSLNANSLEVVSIQRRDFFTFLFLLFYLLLKMPLEEQTGATYFGVFKERFQKIFGYGPFWVIDKLGNAFFPKSICFLCEKREIRNIKRIKEEELSCIR